MTNDERDMKISQLCEDVAVIKSRVTFFEKLFWALVTTALAQVGSVMYLITRL